MKGTDYFREFLGVKVLDAKDGYAKVSMQIAKEHTNSVGMTHGGVVFALADCAFAEAVNFGEKQAVAVQVGINFLKPSVEGDVLTAEAVRISEGKTFALCDVKVSKGDRLIASFSGLAYKLQPEKPSSNSQ
ncbi:MAG: hotdog fold thioesterase [Candidatus Bathyarchaeota archaeon]|nr:hotdog fold thioesterase [Candidatus Bathyarchaeota archaeon]